MCHERWALHVVIKRKFFLHLSHEMVKFLWFYMCNYVDYNRFYGLTFYIYICCFFISLYAKIKCLQHSVIYHGGVIVCLIFLLT